MTHVDLHLGVHKTATTHLQRYWQQCVQVLPGMLPHVPALAEIRAELTPFCRGDSGGEVGSAQHSAAQAFLARALANGGEGGLLLSDENMLGSCEQVLLQQSLYPHALPRLRRLAKVLGAARPVRLWLSVRDYAAYLSSAYCETLRHGPYRPFRRAYRGINLEMRGWEHLAADVIAAFPGAQLMCWPYEALERARPLVTATVFGVSASTKLPAPGERRDRPSLSGMALRLLDEIHHKHGAEEATRMRPMVERVVTGPQLEPFDPWTDEERDRLRQAYARSLTALRSLPAVKWLG